MTLPVSTMRVRPLFAGRQDGFDSLGRHIDIFLGDGPCARKGEAPVVRSDLYGTCVERLDTAAHASS